MSNSGWTLGQLTAAAVLCISMVACGGGGSSPAAVVPVAVTPPPVVAPPVAPVPDPEPAAIEGVATPSSVSVVTATNAT
jgi:hypothetical protein